MAVPYKQLRRDLAETRERTHEHVESVLRLVVGSRRTMEEAREAIARADVVLARRLSDVRAQRELCRISSTRGRSRPHAVS